MQTYRIVDTSKQRVYIHYAARPFLVLEIYYRGYRGGHGSMTIARYATERDARIAIGRRGGQLEEAA